MAKRRSRIGVALIIAGVVLLAICALMWRGQTDVAWSDFPGPGSLFIGVGFASIACITVGLMQLRFRFGRALKL